MSREEFWGIIKTSRENAQNDLTFMKDEIFRQLVLLPPAEIVEFDEIMNELKFPLLNQRVARMIHKKTGHVSDDTMEYFVLWLISNGKETYESVLKNPKHILELDTHGEHPQFEELLYVTVDAYDKICGEGAFYARVGL